MNVCITDGTRCIAFSGMRHKQAFGRRGYDSTLWLSFMRFVPRLIAIDPEMLIIAPTAHFFTITQPSSIDRDRTRASREVLSRHQFKLTTGGDLRMSSTSPIQQHFDVLRANIVPVHLEQHNGWYGVDFDANPLYSTRGRLIETYRRVSLPYASVSSTRGVFTSRIQWNKEHRKNDVSVSILRRQPCQRS